MKAIRGGYQQPPSIRNVTASLKWILQDPNVHTVVAGFTTFEQMEIDLSVMEDLAFTEPERIELQKEVSIRGLYCQGCRQCFGQCLQNLPIPDLMRAYMYTYNYKNLPLAQDLVVSLDLPSNVCGDCVHCPVKCSEGFNVRGKIRDVVRIREVPPEFIA
jgi:hypothetical protein